MDVTVREVTDPADAAIAGFGRMQNAAYFAPETLIPADYVPRMLESDTAGRHNFLVVAEVDSRVVGGTLFHWLAAADSGFSSFMGVERELRGRGIGRRMHDHRFRVLDQAAGHPIQGVFIDVVNPIRLTPSDLGREWRVGSDPWMRRRALRHLGFRQVDIRYEQPVGGPNGGPVTNLDLLFCPHVPTDCVATSLVVATMRAYWSAWLGRETERHARELEARAHGASRLALVSPEPPRPHT